MSGAASAYSVLITLALLLNGMAVACTSPLRDLLAPLRERSLLLGAVVIDLIVVPVALLVPAAVGGASAETYAGLVLLAASSTGAIGVALTRIGRGDLPVTVSLVTALGVANLLTVPLLMALLLPEAITVPVTAVARSLLLLLVLPLTAGAVLRWSLTRLRRHPESVARTARRLGTASTLVLGLALATGLGIDPAGVVDALVGIAALAALCSVAAAGVAALVLTDDGPRRRSLWLIGTARAVGVALAVAAIHLPGAAETRATVLAVGGLTQALPILVLLGRDRWVRSRGGSWAGRRGSGRSGRRGGAARAGGPARA